LDRLVIQKGNFVGAKSKSAISEISELDEILNAAPDMAGKIDDEISDEFLFNWENIEEEAVLPTNVEEEEEEEEESKQEVDE